MTQGYFEVSQFHSTPVALFDSHWFARRIIETDGANPMCLEIRGFCQRRVCPDGHAWLTLPSYNAATMPYRDFMARHRADNLSGFRVSNHLSVIFGLEDRAAEERRLRLKTAEKMLEAPPIRYCVAYRVVK